MRLASVSTSVCARRDEKLNPQVEHKSSRRHKFLVLKFHNFSLIFRQTFTEKKKGVFNYKLLKRFVFNFFKRLWSVVPSLDKLRGNLLDKQKIKRE